MLGVTGQKVWKPPATRHYVQCENNYAAATQRYA